MPRRENSVYEGAAIPRGDSFNEYKLFKKTRAKTHPKYVHGRIGMSRLLHKVSFVELHWNDFSWRFIHRLKHPKMYAHTVCGMSFLLELGKGITCEFPKPNTVLCGKCHGEAPTFGRGSRANISRREAKDALGCSATGQPISKYLYKG